jgi:hypothetical protein
MPLRPDQRPHARPTRVVQSAGVAGSGTRLAKVSAAPRGKKVGELLSGVAADPDILPTALEDKISECRTMISITEDEVRWLRHNRRPTAAALDVLAGLKLALMRIEHQRSARAQQAADLLAPGFSFKRAWTCYAGLGPAPAHVRLLDGCSGTRVAQGGAHHETAVTDDLTQRGGSDRQRIALDQDDVRSWARKFGVSEEELRTAVRVVGARADAVERYLNGGPSDREGP